MNEWLTSWVTDWINKCVKKKLFIRTEAKMDRYTHKNKQKKKCDKTKVQLLPVNARRYACWFLFSSCLYTGRNLFLFPYKKKKKKNAVSHDILHTYFDCTQQSLNNVRESNRFLSYCFSLFFCNSEILSWKQIPSVDICVLFKITELNFLLTFLIPKHKKFVFLFFTFPLNSNCFHITHLNTVE